jgi:hypothetical protein
VKSKSQTKPSKLGSNSTTVHPSMLLPKDGTMGRMMRGLSGGPSDLSDSSNSLSEDGNGYKPDPVKGSKGAAD